MADRTYTIGYDVFAPTHGTTTVSKTIAEIAQENNWTSGTKYYSMDLGDLTVTLTGGDTYNGKYDSTNQSWDISYDPEHQAQLVVQTKNTSAKIMKIIFNYTIERGQVYWYEGSSNISSGYALSPNNNTVTLNMYSTLYGGTVRLTSIEVEYEV